MALKGPRCTKSGLLLIALALLVVDPARGDLFAYIERAEPAFAWKQLHNDTLPEGKVFSFQFTSQTWRGIDWTHQLRVYLPAEVKYRNHVLLFITGGSSTSQVKPEDHAQAFALARACGGCVAVLPQVPNQPLLDGKKEDDLIGETFVNYINTQEPDWPLLLPMVKSAVKAMDVVEQWSKLRGQPLDGFVVTGASKRGWTTWLTAAVDPRVKAIAPMVIPTLNMKAQTEHQKASWGFYSEQIEDYTRRGLTEKFDDPVGSQLWKMVDPWSYLDRINVPVLQINGTNDRYWTLDSMNLYWDDIKVPKYVVYLPNAGHDLKEHRDWATSAVGALFRHVALGTPMPYFKESREIHAGTGRPKINVDRPDPKPIESTVWTAAAPTLDFREAMWESGPTLRWEGTNSGGIGFVGKRPEGTQRAAMFVDLKYEIDGLEYHLSTRILIEPKIPVVH